MIRESNDSGASVRYRLALACLSLLLASCGWPLFHYGPARTGHNPLETTITPANVHRLELAWQVDFDRAQPLPTIGSPVVAHGNVYVPLVSTDEQNSLHARDATTGERRWSVPFATSTELGVELLTFWPGVGDRTVYVGTLHGPQTRTRGYDVTSGREMFNAGSGAANSPLRLGKLLYATYGSRETGPTSYGWRAWDAGSGELLFGSAPSSQLALGPAIVDGVLYTWQNNRLEAFDASGVTNCVGSPRVCAPLWTSAEQETGFVNSLPSVAHGLVYVKGRRELRAYPAAGCGSTTCAPVWRGPIDSGPTTATVTGHTVFIGSSDGRLYAFDATGCGVPQCAPRWTTTPAAGSLSVASVAGGVVYVGSADGRAYAFDAAGCDTPPCAPLWSVATNAPVDWEVTVVNGIVYVGSGATLRAFRLPVD